MCLLIRFIFTIPGTNAYQLDDEKNQNPNLTYIFFSNDMPICNIWYRNRIHFITLKLFKLLPRNSVVLFFLLLLFIIFFSFNTAAKLCNLI